MTTLALAQDWRDEDDDGPDQSALDALFIGQVASVKFNCVRDVLTLTYQDGRQVSVRLHQCRVHVCDETMLIVSDEETK